ncbi:MAG: 50S ribosomal protein L23 [Candidatus Pacebacteria bacterium]|nr:50S ribosomal protein L23 [Candidatus Paceibacterota bacterium]
MASLSIKKHATQVIRTPHITEKASRAVDAQNVYTFQVEKEATKKSIAKAVTELYKVTPLKVAIVNLPAKTVMSKGKIGSTKAIKKAYVYLKKGDKIDLI